MSSTPSAAVNENWRNELPSAQDQYHFVFQNGLFCDTKFIVGPEKVPVYSHALLLKIRSSVFEKIFEKLPNDGQTKEIVIDKVDANAFRKFLQYLYNQKLKVDDDEALQILLLSKKYGIQSLSQKCAAKLKPAISENNVVSIFQAAREFKEIELETKAFQFLYSNIAAVIEVEDFLNLSHANLCYLLERDELEIKEMTLFNAVIKWAKSECSKHRLNHSPKHFRLVLKEALNAIRFPLMSSEEFHSTVISMNLLNERESGEVSKYLNAEPSSREFVKSGLFSCKPRNYIGDEDEVDLSKVDDENHKRLAKYAIKKSYKELPDRLVVSSLILDIEPLEKSIDLEKLDHEIRAIKKYGLHWGASKVNLSKDGNTRLKISFIAEESRSYGVGTVVESIQDMSDFVRQVYVVSFREEIEVTK